jgi:hypothetical protein
VPRMPKQATTETTPRDAALSLVVREAEAEAAKAKKVSQATRLTYEAKSQPLAVCDASRWPVHDAAPAS